MTAEGRKRQFDSETAAVRSEMDRYLPVNILDSGRSGRLGLDAVS
jgi:hypothetical protein